MHELQEFNARITRIYKFNQGKLRNFNDPVKSLVKLVLTGAIEDSIRVIRFNSSNKSFQDVFQVYLF